VGIRDRRNGRNAFETAVGREKYSKVVPPRAMAESERFALDLETVSQLYTRYAVDLNRVREEEARFYRRWMASRPFLGRGRSYSWIPKPVRHLVASTYFRIRTAREWTDLSPSFGDVQSELVYLFVRTLEPSVVVEISPAGGWSTSWILSALRDNGHGTLHSYDRLNDSTRTIPEELRHDRWVFTQGDVRKLVYTLPTDIDYLFLDADHSRSFAEWYIGALLSKLRPNVLVSVDDVYRNWEVDKQSEFGESKVVLDWLSRHQSPSFTASPVHDRAVFGAIQEVRRSIGVSPQILPTSVNPAVFFFTPAGDRPNPTE
jgi:predicted O-methyltransferase YrrM